MHISSRMFQYTTKTAKDLTLCTVAVQSSSHLLVTHEGVVHLLLMHIPGKNKKFLGKTQTSRAYNRYPLVPSSQRLLPQHVRIIHPLLQTMLWTKISNHSNSISKPLYTWSGHHYCRRHFFKIQHGHVRSALCHTSPTTRAKLCAIDSLNNVIGKLLRRNFQPITKTKRIIG